METGKKQSPSARIDSMGWRKGMIFLRDKYSDTYNKSYGIFTGKILEEDNIALLEFTDGRYVREKDLEPQTINTPNIMWFFDKEIKRLENEHKQSMEIYMLEYFKIYEE